MTRKLTQEEFVTKAKAVHGDTYDYSKAVYINAKTKVCVIDKEIGEFWVTPDKHLYAGQGPSENAGKRRADTRGRMTKEEFIKIATKKQKDIYDYSLINFTTVKDRVNIICKTHGVFDQTVEGHLSGYGCRYCRDDKRGLELRIKFEDFVKRAKSVHGDKYIYSEDKYVKIYCKTIIICKKHGKFEQIGSDHVSGAGCKKCSASRGEVKIENYLMNNNVKYETQFKIDKKLRYRYDFYLPEYNLLIEYDGDQHFRSIKHWGGEENLKRVQASDKLKNKMAEDNNYKLLRIDYKNFNNIEKILEKEVYNGD